MTTLPQYPDKPQDEINGPGGQFRVIKVPFRPGVSAVGFGPLKPYMPDVVGLTLADAAQAWARAGFCILPVKPGSKNAGSYLGAGWPKRSSRDLEQVRSWWSRWPNAGIAIHTGASGVVVADVDVDALPENLAPLRLGAVHLTRANTSSRRGHYIFAATETFVSGKLPNAVNVGEVRSGNTVIVVAPTPHAKNGLYRVLNPLQPIPALSAEVRALLRSPAKAGSFDVEGFKESFTSSEYLGALKNVLRRYRKLVSDDDLDASKGKNRHDAMLDVLCLALKESRAGAYPAALALERLERLWLSSIDGRPNHDLREFQRMLPTAVSAANADDVVARRQIMRRDYGSDTRTTAADLDSYKRNKEAAMSQDDDLDDDFDWDGLDEELDPSAPTEDGINWRMKSLRESREAKRRLNQSAWEVPEDQGNALQQFLNRGPEPQWLIDDLILPGARLLVNAQWKTGKTTLGINLAKSLVTGSDFLRRFSMPGLPLQSVAYWNHEVSQYQFVTWLDEAGLVEPDEPYGQSIHLLNTRDFRSPITFDNEPAVDWTVDWLKQRKVQFWLIDTFSRLYTGSEKENDEIVAWWAKMDEIAAKAGVQNVAIFHHTGYSEDAAERGRGGSALMGLPDVLVSYRHNGKPGQFAPDNIRYFKAFGRSVDVPEFEVDFDSATRELYATGSHNTRQEPDLDVDARTVWDLVASLDEPINKSAICKKLDLSMKGRLADRTKRIFELAESMRWIERKPGKGNEILFCAGPQTPAGAIVKSTSELGK